MGTHPSGPAVISGHDTTLKQWIQAHPEALGDAVLKRFGTDLPYLFKVKFVRSGALRYRACQYEASSGGQAQPSSQASDLVCMDMQVLSVRTALSIQSHPDKALAERLHAQNPKVSNSRVLTGTASGSNSTSGKVLC
eukprot:GHUV01052812.1.p1 GENE.GHUV01052812.1~~GHUV01052812.1.p1  ORF type:complete len:137 (-),score=23.77 GHUV01052812.1:220-630(-)